MARKKLTEYLAKKLLFAKLNQPYDGLSIQKNKTEDIKKIDTLDKKKTYVVKVDQGVKKRAKQGLLAVHIAPKEISSLLKEFSKKGYSQFLIEDFVQHDKSEEKYLSLERAREGIIVRFSVKGGIDIEENTESVKEIVLHENNNIQEISKTLTVPEAFLKNLLAFFDEQFVSFLEINPLVIIDGKIFILDLAVEVDSAGEFFLPADRQGIKNGWTHSDFTEPPGQEKTIEEKNIALLQANSQASLKMEVLNSNGSIFVMLFGGGGSIVIADEIYNQGYGKELANYSDHSGNPREEETTIYVKNILDLLLKSRAKKKVFLIAGTYANFTDVAVTFRGVVKALEDVKTKLAKQQIKIFVRRPGPNQEKGLPIIKNYLLKENLYGGVWDETMVITDVVAEALSYIHT